MKVKDITNAIEAVAPLYLQESYDNSGMQVGDADARVTGVLLCTDVTERIVLEAVECGANLVISHHPIIFRGLKKITGRTHVERIVALAIKHGIALYAAHTNMDNARNGVSYKIAQKLGLHHLQVLEPQRGTLRKVVTFVPQAQVEQVENAMLDAGAGRLGDYDRCSYRMSGTGRYRALEGADPFAGHVGSRHAEPEERVEVLCHSGNCAAVVRALIEAHPYEEPAFDIIALDNEDRYSGSGLVGELPEPVDAREFLQRVKAVMECPSIRFSGRLDGRQVSRVALCGGSGAFLIGNAIAANAQIYLTGDLKYHDFQGHEDRIILADIGHYESEHFTKEIFRDIISKKNPNFAVAFSQHDENPINYI